MEEEESYAETEMQHSDDVFEMSPVISEWLKCLLKAFKQEKEIAVNDVEMSQVVKETRADTSFPNLTMFASIQRSMNEYITTIRELEGNLLFESKIANSEQKLDIAEGNIFQDTQEFWEEAISGTMFTMVSRAVRREISKAMFGLVFEEILKVKTEFEAREAEDNEKQTKVWDPGR